MAGKEYVVTKTTAIKGLIARNRVEDAPEKLVGFPFMLVAPSDRCGLGFEVSLDQEKKKAVFTAPNRMMLLGDVDVCSFLGHLQNN